MVAEMREIHKLTNIDNPYEGTEPPNLLSMMVTPIEMEKWYDYIVLGIPYKKNRSARLQKKMRKIVRRMNDQSITRNADAMPQSSSESL